MAKEVKPSKEAEQTPKKAVRISQSDIPAYSLTEALRVAQTIWENYASKPTKPLDVAAAMNLTPTASPFKMLTGASIAFGLTLGGYNAQQIEVTPLAKTIFRPVEENQDLESKRVAFLKPRIIGEFLTKYNGSPMPKDNIAKNVLVEMGVPSDRVEAIFNLILDGAKDLGLITEIRDKAYINLTPPSNGSPEVTPSARPVYEPEVEERSDDDPRPVGIDKSSPASEVPNKRVFITHGKNAAFVDPIKKLLSFGEMEAVVSVERQSVSQPVPEKVMNDMRSCSAAIIHVEDEQKVLDKDAKEITVLNSNVLIEIGASMALYGKRFILLVKDGVKLPSNLQGLFEVRYTGDALDGNATIRLLEAINELKKQPKV